LFFRFVDVVLLTVLFGGFCACSFFPFWFFVFLVEISLLRVLFDSARCFRGSGGCLSETPGVIQVGFFFRAVAVCRSVDVSLVDTGFFEGRAL